MSSRTVALAGALLTLLAAPAGASAATLEPLKPCYVTAATAQGDQSEGVDVVASGFTPNAKVDVLIDGVAVPALAGLQVDANGQLGVQTTVQVAAPFIGAGSRKFTVTLAEQGNPANVATASARTTALGVSVKPRSAKPSKIIRFKGNGFTARRPVYAHYVHGGKVRATVKMSGTPGGCGKWKKFAAQIPVDDPATGRWTVQFDQRKKFFQQPDGVFVRLTIQVTRIFG